ncbi:MAG: hypothetical protein GC155_17405 [Alphaproteobacteria bacterium]|nr:hypothetical protein [Alphaproteobacteria bacterium]
MKAWFLPLAALALMVSACGPKPATTAPDTDESAASDGDFSEPPTPESIAASAAAEASVLEACGPVTTKGFCGVVFGGPVDAARHVYPGKLETLAGDDAQTGMGCYELFGNAPIEGVSFLVENGKVGRVDFLSGGPKTAEGFGVGSDAETIRSRFGGALSEHVNKYEPDVTDMVVDQPPGRVIFEIQDGKVRAWRAGVPPTIDYVERCG